MNISEIPLTNGGVALIDSEDLPKVENLTWKYVPKLGVCNYTLHRKRATFLHKLICPDAPIIHFLDGNRKNSCKANLSFKGEELQSELSKWHVKRIVLLDGKYASYKKEFPFSEDDRIKVKREAEAFKTVLFKISNEDFLDCILNGKELDLSGGWITEGDIVKIPLSDNTYALIDSKYKQIAQQYNWKFSKNKKYGVITSHEGQIIQLHNLISPYQKVFHINRDKRDCRMVNLKADDYERIRHIQFRTTIKITRFKNTFRIGRKASDSKGVKHAIYYSWSFGKKAKYKTEEEAYAAAYEKWQTVKDLSDEQVIEASKALIPRMSTNQIISDWDIWGDREISVEECIQLGIKTKIRENFE